MKIFRPKNLGSHILKLEFSEIEIQLENNIIVKDKLDFFDEGDFEKFDVKHMNHENFDLIEIDQNLENQLIVNETYLEWGLHYTQSFDAFINKQNQLLPIQLNAKTLSVVLTKDFYSLNIEKSAVLIGEEIFLLSFARQLVQIGYKKLLLIHPQGLDISTKIKKLKAILFETIIEQINFEDLGNIVEPASFLAIDVDFRIYPNLFETISYFNFLTPQAFFLDLRDFIDPQLKIEAEKAVLTVYPSDKFLMKKYELVYKYLNSHQT